MSPTEIRAAGAPGTLELPPNDIHLWFAFPEECCEPVLMRQYLSLLSADELERHDRFHFDVDRRHFLVTRALVRTVLALYAAPRPREWKFHADRYGRPTIANAGEGVQRLSFNLSNTDGLVMLGVTAERCLGVDVESTDRSVPIEVADSFFSKREVEALGSESEPKLFWDLWTLKESYIKACGMGLSIPLDQFDFTLDGSRIEFAVCDTSSNLSSGWQFWQFYPTARHAAAVCAQAGSHPIHLEIRKTVPLRSTQAVSLPPSRWTAR